MILFNLTDAENAPKIEVDKKGATYSIKVVELAGKQRNIIVEDTQRTPFWRNLKRKAEFFKEVYAKTPTLTTEKWDFICTELSAADEAGDIGAEEEPTTREAEITDKQITDCIMDKHPFYCDKSDVNQTLYLFTGTHWSNAAAESIVLNEISDIFKEEERRRGMVLERTINFIKGQAMNRQVKLKPPELIPFKNGLYDLTTGELKPHGEQYFYTNVIPHDYTSGARCPKFMKWLGEVIKPDDTEFLQEWMGYNFYASYPEPGFLVLIGTGQNAKSCFSRLFKQLIGEKNVTEISLADLTYDDFAPAQLEHKLANISDDIGSTTITNTGRLKKVSSGSGITVAKKFQQEHDITPYAKPTYSCNEPPEIKDSSEAIKLRLKVVEFPYVFTKKPVNGQKQARDRREIDRELKGEIPGIINWALEGLKRFIDNKFTFTASKSTEETWKFYQRNSNPVVCFIEEGLEFTDDNQDVIFKEPMWKTFQAWVLERKIKRKISRDKFFREMKAQEVTPSRPREYEREQVYIGVKLVQKSKHLLVPTPPEKINNYVEEDKKKESRERGEKGKLGRLDTPNTSQKTESTAQEIERTLSDFRGQTNTIEHFASELGITPVRMREIFGYLRDRGEVQDLGGGRWEVVK